MKVLLHTCCGPCAIYPVRILRQKDWEVMGFYYRHNIHPYTECVKRQETLETYANGIALKVIYQEGYELEKFIRNVAFREEDRCRVCYHERLRSTALFAKKGRFNAFTTSLLYSRFQNHEMIRSIGEAVGKSVGVKFLYEDFRGAGKRA